MSAAGPSDYLLEVPDAVRRVVADVRALSAERVPLLEAQGRVLASDVRSTITLPPWANSAMDGYAVRAADLETLPATLRVIESVAAGQFPSQHVGALEAVRIMTGAPTPEGADTVVRVEDTDGGLDRVVVRDARDAGKNVRPRGEDVTDGQVAVTAGTVLGAAQLGVLAAIGEAAASVHRVPRVAILTSGDELVELDRFDEVRAGRKIVSSNSITLQALVRAAGGEPHYLGIAADTRESLREHLEHARDADLLITSAGISVGEFDYVREVLLSLGADMKFWRVRMRPGAPIGFGWLGAMPWIGLPGNPVSTMVTFELFARPVIRRMCGHTRLFRRPARVTIDDAITITPGLTHFLRAIITPGPDGIRARLTGPQGSGILTSMSGANALLVVPPDRARREAGEQLLAIPLGDEAALSETFAL